MRVDEPEDTLWEGEGALGERLIKGFVWWVIVCGIVCLVRAEVAPIGYTYQCAPARSRGNSRRSKRASQVL